MWVRDKSNQVFFWVQISKMLKTNNIYFQTCFSAQNSIQRILLRFYMEENFLKKLSKNWFLFTTISISSPAVLSRSLEIRNSTSRLRLMILMQYWHFPHNATLPRSEKHLLLQIKILSGLFIYRSILLTPTTKCLLCDKDYHKQALIFIIKVNGMIKLFHPITC